MIDPKLVTCNRRQDWLASKPSDGRCYFCRFNLLHSEREHMVKIGRVRPSVENVAPVPAATEAQA